MDKVKVLSVAIIAGTDGVKYGKNGKTNTGPHPDFVRPKPRLLQIHVAFAMTLIAEMTGKMLRSKPERDAAYTYIELNIPYLHALHNSEFRRSCDAILDVYAVYRYGSRVDWSL